MTCAWCRCEFEGAQGEACQSCREYAAKLGIPVCELVKSKVVPPRIAKHIFPMNDFLETK